MARHLRWVRWAGCGVLASLSWAGPAGAVGEGSADGFPNWAERVIHEWMNRARSDPQVEMTACGAACGEKACYSPVGPVWYSAQLNRAARFHAAEMVQQSYFAHDSACTVVSNISSIYPATCNGAASCACVGGTKTCSPTCTSWSARVKLFGPSASGEIIASSTDPSSAFYQWLYENSSTTACQYSSANGHRWLILKSSGSVGTGSAGRSVGDFSGGGTAYKIPSGSHYPRQATSVDVWANWYDTAGPSAARVNVDGVCTTLTLGRGSQTNGAWTAKISGVGTGCHRYYFVFRDSANQEVSYPSTGSLGIGPAGSCADWDSQRPSMGTGCGSGSGGTGGTGGTGGIGGTGGTGGVATGGTGGLATGGTGGVATGGTGGLATGGTGGVATGGTGGVATGGTGGVATGGTGGASSGGTGGLATGGTSSGGTGGLATGGTSSGGTSSGGTSSGGTSSGGASGAATGGNAGAPSGGGTSGAAGSAGAVIAGGMAGSAGSTSSGGSATGSGDGSDDDSSCGCGVPGAPRDSSQALGALALLGLLLRRRSRRGA